MKQLLFTLVICLFANVLKSQNVFPTTTGSYVGIGTTSPVVKFHVSSTDTSNILFNGVTSVLTI